MIYVTRAIMGDELHHKPVEEFEYSNMNYDLLGLIIQNVTSNPIQNILQIHGSSLCI